MFHGRKGELRQLYREGMEDQLGALGLVVNAIVLRNTRSMGETLDEGRQSGQSVKDAGLARLSPLFYEHVNRLGWYDSTLPKDVVRGHVRPLRDPDSFEALLA